MRATIAHLDMDAFFVAIELLRRPELRGKPVVVATNPDPNGRGVVMTASYEARRFGVHSALPLAIARRRCPQAVVLPRDMALYQRGSWRLMEVLEGFSDRIEVAGLDEAYVDLSGSLAPQARARQMKSAVTESTRLTCSVGLAPNKLLAKIASDLDKPDGFSVLSPEMLLTAVGERPASLIPGVGPKTAERLAAIGILTVADLAHAQRDRIEAALGPRLGGVIWDRAQGIDDRPVVTEREPKSESRETTFPADVDDAATLRETLDRLADSLCADLNGRSYAGRTVTVKIRLRPFRTHTRSRTLPSPTADRAVIGSVARELLEGFDRDAPVRLLGVGVSGLVGSDAPDEAESSGSAAVNPAPEPLNLDLG
jgi:DNA polymerase IV